METQHRELAKYTINSPAAALTELSDGCYDGHPTQLGAVPCWPGAGHKFLRKKMWHRFGWTQAGTLDGHESQGLNLSSSFHREVNSTQNTNNTSSVTVTALIAGFIVWLPSSTVRPY